MSHLELIQEVADILRGEHHAYAGLSDPYTNAEAFLHQVGRDLEPVDSYILVEDLLNNAGDYSNLVGLSPDRIQWCARRISQGALSTISLRSTANEGESK